MNRSDFKKFLWEWRLVFSLVAVMLFLTSIPLVLWTQPEPMVERPVRTSKTLRKYGLEECSWMKTSSELRYPRVKNGNAPENMRACVDTLWRWQELGELVFKPISGQALGALFVGGFHGNTDDGDLDLKFASRLPSSEDLCSEFGLGALHGLKALPARSGNSREDDQLMVNVTEQMSLPRPCICRWEEFEVLCDNEESRNTFDLFGGSWWVPPCLVGKMLTLQIRWVYGPEQPFFCLAALGYFNV